MTADAVGGVWQYALDLSRALGEHDVQTVLAALGPAPDAAQRAAAEAIPGVTVVETGLPLDWLSDGDEPVLAAGRAIAALAAEHGADIVHLNTPALAAVPMPVPVVAATHGCISTWWEAARPAQPLAPEFAWHARLTGEGLRAADRLVAPTASYARAVQRRYGLAHAPLAVHNGRTPHLAAPAPMADRALTVGRLWDEVKRAGLLDRVAGGLSVPFDAAGAATGPHGERIELHHLRALGHVDDDALARCLAVRPVFVSAASFEPFGLAVLEAAAAGCALVLSDIGSFRELWDGAAVFVAGEDERVWAKAIGDLVADRAGRERLGADARARAARYTPGAMAAAMHAIYADACDGRRAAA